MAGRIVAAVLLVVPQLCLCQLVHYGHEQMVHNVRQLHQLRAADDLLHFKWDVRRTMDAAAQAEREAIAQRAKSGAVGDERPVCEGAKELAWLLDMIDIPLPLPAIVCRDMHNWDRQGVNDTCAANLQDMVCALAETIDAACNSSMNVTQAMAKNMWLFRMLDAMGKLQPGVSQGSLYKTLGAYDACAAVDARVPPAQPHLAPHIVKGQFCKAIFKLNTTADVTALADACPKEVRQKQECSAAITLGACLPATCANEDLYVLWYYVLPRYKPMNQTMALINSRLCWMAFQCESRETVWSDFFALSMTVFCILVLIAMAVGTYYDYFVYRPHLRRIDARHKAAALLSAERLATSEMDRIEHENADATGGQTKEEYIYYLPWYWKALIAFSVYTNGHKIMTTRRREGTIECVHGIRVISMAWVMLGHTYYFALGFIENPRAQLDMPAEYFFQMIGNATVAVDTFFVMSGFLLTYLFLKRMKATKGAQIKSPKFWIMYYVHRYLRLTPVYMVVIVLGYAFWDYLGVGPMWSDKHESVIFKFCSSNWWHNALYINNLFKFGEQCIGWTWYLANDMQFYWISPPLLIALYYKPWFALAGTAVAMSASAFARGYLTVEYDLPPTVTVSVNPHKWAAATSLLSDMMYQRPYMRIGTYLVGVLLGWLLSVQHGKGNISKGRALLGWLATFVLSQLVLFGMYDFARTGDISYVARVIYASLSRTAWGVAVAGTIYLCVVGAGGPINSFLSWNLWFPLSRLTYCTYLLHEYVLLYIYTTLRNPEYGCHYQSVYVFLMALAMTTALALVFSLSFEAPVMALEKLVFERPERPAKRERAAAEPTLAQQPAARAPSPSAPLAANSHT